MKYPNSSMTFQKNLVYANRGMNLESKINEANKYYIDNDIAFIYKKPTPINIVSVDKNKIITKAYFKEVSTLDYNGIYKGKYIEFDAKETKNKSSFPLNNISNHQLEYIKKILKHNAIVFLIININDTNILFPGKELIKFINLSNSKSIKYEYLVKNGYLIGNYKNIEVNYIKELDKLLEVNQNEIIK